MYQLWSSSELLFLLFLGASARFIKENLDCGNYPAPDNSPHLEKDRKNDRKFNKPKQSLGGKKGSKARLLNETENHESYDLFPYADCGVNSIAVPRIYGGTEVKEGEFPWMVAFSLGCGGTLINARWILTAAHCFYEEDGSAYVAYLGTIKCEDIFDDHIYVERTCDSSATASQIIRVITHERYINKYPYSNDIALVQIRNPVTFSDKIRPICIDYENRLLERSIFDNYAEVSGWGTTEHDVTKTLLKASIKIWKPSKCKEIDESYDRLYHICAGGEEGVSTCQGDSGGPLLVTQYSNVSNTRRYYQVGITSFGDCGIENDPVVYTNVSTYAPWIYNKISAYEEEEKLKKKEEEV